MLSAAGEKEKKKNKTEKIKGKRKKKKKRKREEEEEEILPPFPSLIFFHCEGRSGHSQLPIVALYSE